MNSFRANDVVSQYSPSSTQLGDAEELTSLSMESGTDDDCDENKLPPDEEYSFSNSNSIIATVIHGIIIT